MPALTSPPAFLPSATTEAGLVRRRVWKAPEVRSHSLVVLTLPRLYLSPMTGEPKPETVAAIERGGDMDAILGPLATAVDLIAIRRVRLDLVINTLHVEYQAGQGKAKTAIRFATSEAADTAFSKLWRRLGDEFKLKPFRADPWAVARGPVLAILTLVAATGLLALGLNALEDTAAGQHGTLAGRLPGWRLVCAAGGAAAAGVTVWLYRRLTRPPERLDLMKEG
jgi:hypothetical protein